MRFLGFRLEALLGQKPRTRNQGPSPDQERYDEGRNDRLLDLDLNLNLYLCLSSAYLLLDIEPRSA